MLIFRESLYYRINKCDNLLFFDSKILALNVTKIVTSGKKKMQLLVSTKDVTKLIIFTNHCRMI